jgi:hypothetical protein
MFTAHDADARFRPEVAAAGPVEVQTRVNGWDFDDWGFDAAGVDMAEGAGWARHAAHRGAVAAVWSESESADAAGVTLHDAVCRLLELDWY